MIIQVCIGSSCHLKGSERIVDLLQRAITTNKFERDITLAGSFCMGKCSHEGVTVQINDDEPVGVTVEGFYDFFQNYVVTGVEKERAAENG